MKKALLGLMMILWCGVAWGQEKEVEKAQDYWVYVRLEDRSGVTTADDAGRSKAGDVVAVLPVTDQFIPSETEKKEWMIYKTALTETQVNEMLTPWIETETKTETVSIPKEVYEDAAQKEAFLESIRAVSVTSAKADTKSYSVSAVVEYEKPIAYRKNKLDTSKLGIEVKKGLVAEKIDSTKIETSVKTVDDLAKYELKRKFYAYVQRPAIRLANVITRKAFAETVSTINKTGEDYNTLALWEDAVDGDLVTNTSQPTAECYDDDGTLTSYVKIDGSTSNASYYMKITVPEGERHAGKFSTSVGFYTHNGNSYNNDAISINDEFVIVEWVQASAGNYANGIGMWMAGSSNASTVRNCIIKGTEEIGSRGNVNWFNNIVEVPETCFFLNYPDWSATLNVMNNTCISKTTNKGGIVIQNPSGTINIKNNISFSNGTAAAYGKPEWADTFTNNVSNDATGNITNQTTDIFTDWDNSDYHLDSSASSVIDAGTDLSSLFTIDIDGTTRSGTWDIGADEYVATYYPFKKFNHGINVGVF